MQHPLTNSSLNNCTCLCTRSTTNTRNAACTTPPGHAVRRTLIHDAKHESARGERQAGVHGAFLVLAIEQLDLALPARSGSQRGLAPGHVGEMSCTFTFEACANVHAACMHASAKTTTWHVVTSLQDKRESERERERERETETRAERKTEIHRGKLVDACWHTSFARSLKLGTLVDVTVLQTANCNLHAPGAPRATTHKSQAWHGTRGSRWHMVAGELQVSPRREVRKRSKRTCRSQQILFQQALFLARQRCHRADRIRKLSL